MRKRAPLDRLAPAELESRIAASFSWSEAVSSFGAGESEGDHNPPVAPAATVSFNEWERFQTPYSAERKAIYGFESWRYRAGLLPPGHRRKRISLESLKGRKVVLYFYPKDDTSGCTLEAQNFQALKGAFAACDTRGHRRVARPP